MVAKWPYEAWVRLWIPLNYCKLIRASKDGAYALQLPSTLAAEVKISLRIQVREEQSLSLVKREFTMNQIVSSSFS